MSQTPQQTGISVMNERISGDNIDGDQSILKQPKAQVERAQMPINNKAARWQITAQCEKLRQTIQEGTKHEESLTAACEMLHQGSKK